MKKPFTFLQIIIMSFYSGKLYRQIYKSHNKSGFFYALKLVIFICCILAFLSAFFIYNLNYQTQIDKFAVSLLGKNIEDKENEVNRIFNIFTQMPELEYNEGKIKSSGTAPHLITDINNKLAVLIDTEGNFPRDTIKNYNLANNFFVITDRNIVFSPRSSETIDSVGEPEFIRNFIKFSNNFPNLKYQNDEIIDIDKSREIYKLPIAYYWDKILNIVFEPGNSDPDKAENEFIYFGKDFMVLSPLLNQDKIIVPYKDLSSDKLAKIMNEFVTYYKKITLLSVIIITPFIILIIFGIYSLLIIIYSKIALYLAELNNIKLNIFKARQLVAVALMPLIIFCFIIPPFSLIFFLIYFIYGLIYISFAIKSVIGK